MVDTVGAKTDYIHSIVVLLLVLVILLLENVG